MQKWFEAIGLMELDEITVLVRLLLAVFCGGVLGFERMRKLRAAGLRTYIMVCVGACICMMVGENVTGNYGTGDPTRIAAQVVSGIGFIGAGTIIFTGYNRVRGLTTAAGLWAVAALGLAIGAGMYVSSLIVLVVLLVAMVVGSMIQNRVLAKSNRLRCYVLLSDEESFKNMLVHLKDKTYHIVDFESKPVVGNCVGLAMTLDLPPGVCHLEALEMLQSCSGAAFTEEV